MVTFTGRQARLERASARANELINIAQRSFPYPSAVGDALEYLVGESEHGRDAYYGVHLFRTPGNRRSSNAAGAMTCLWLDEDEGHFPDNGPDPTAIVSSSATRRHLYWQLARPLSSEWVVAMNRRIAHWAGGDAGKAGLATVLRVPGTNNFKRHPQVDPVTLEITGVPTWEPEVLEQAIPPLPSPECRRKAPSGPYDGPEFEIADFLSVVEVIGEAPDDLGAKFQILCPWVEEHSGGDRTGTYVGQFHGGGLWFCCRHEHCYGRGWVEFRQVIRRELKKLKFIEQGAFYA